MLLDRGSIALDNDNAEGTLENQQPDALFQTAHLFLAKMVATLVKQC